MILGGGSKPRVASPSPVAVQKLGKLGKGQLPLALLAPMLFLMAAAWTRDFLNGNFLFVFCFSPASENLAEMRF